jgi:putative membrane protein
MTDTQTAPGRRRWIGLVAVAVLLPLLAALVLVWSTADRRDRIADIPVAIVNNDTIITDPQPMAAGRALTASLTNPTDGDPKLDWTLTDADDAKEGLRTGAYYAVLTIPSDFSKAILSTGTDNPEAGQIELKSNAAASQTVPYISEQVVAAAAEALGNQSTQGYLKQVYSGFNQIAEGQQNAATSAQQLAGGTADLSQGANQLDQGANQLAGATGQVASGASELKSGTAGLSSGAARIAQGNRDLAAGAQRVNTASGRLAGNAARLADRSRAYADRIRRAAQAAGRVAGGAGRLSTAAGNLADEVSSLSDQCLQSGGSIDFCAQLRATQVRSRVVAGGAEVVARGTGGVARGADVLAGGARALAGADRALAGGARTLQGATRTLSGSADVLARGAGDIASGAATLDSSTGQLVGGAQETSQAAGSLASGSDTLSSSSSQVNDGAQQLSAGLTKGAEQSPTYTDDQQDALASTVSEPVQLTATTQHDGHANGFLIGAIIGVLMWLTALAGALRLDISASRRFAFAPVWSGRIARSQAVPVLVLGLVQGVTVVAAMMIGGVDMASAIGVAVVTLLAAVTFCLIAYAMRLARGAGGIAIFLLFLLVQVAALSNVVPLETAPAPLQTLNGLLPLTAFVDVISRMISGGQVGSVVGPVVVLVLWGLVAFISTLTIVKRQRMVAAPRTTATRQPETASATL